MFALLNTWQLIISKTGGGKKGFRTCRLWDKTHLKPSRVDLLVLGIMFRAVKIGTITSN